MFAQPHINTWEVREFSTVSNFKPSGFCNQRNVSHKKADNCLGHCGKSAK